MTTSLSPAAAARLLAAIVSRVLSGSASGPVVTVPFGDACAVSVGDACLCTLRDAEGGVAFDWAPDSAEAQSFLLPLLDAAIGA